MVTVTLIFFVKCFYLLILYFGQRNVQIICHLYFRADQFKCYMKAHLLRRRLCDWFKSAVWTDMSGFFHAAGRRFRLLSGLASVWERMLCVLICVFFFFLFPPPLRQAWNEAERAHLLPGNWRGLLWPSAHCHQGIYCWVLVFNTKLKNWNFVQKFWLD